MSETTTRPRTIYWCPLCDKPNEGVRGRAPESHPAGYGAAIISCTVCLSELNLRDEDGKLETVLAERNRWQALAGRQQAALDLYGTGLTLSGASWCRSCGRTSPEHAEACILADPDGTAALAELTALRERAEAAEQRAYNLQGQLDHMTKGIAKALELEEDTPAGTLGTVEALILCAEEYKAELAAIEAALDPLEIPTADREGSLPERVAATLLYVRAGHEYGVPALRQQIEERDAALAAAGEALRAMPAVPARRPYDDDQPDGYLESLNDWSANCLAAVEWFLERATADLSSAPALARAVEIDRARREVCDAVERYRQAKAEAWRDVFMPAADAWLRQTTAEAAMFAVAGNLRTLESTPTPTTTTREET
jgi:hypothetical protein